jgi:hypothetical protein
MISKMSGSAALSGWFAHVRTELRLDCRSGGSTEARLEDEEDEDDSQSLRLFKDIEMECPNITNSSESLSSPVLAVSSFSLFLSLGGSIN